MLWLWDVQLALIPFLLQPLWTSMPLLRCEETGVLNLQLLLLSVVVVMISLACCFT
jgi:hypothetical protein